MCNCQYIWLFIHYINSPSPLHALIHPPPHPRTSAMLEISSSFRQCMVPFCTGDIGAEVLASLGAQSLDPILASAPRDPPAPSGPPKGMNGNYQAVTMV